MGQFLDLFRTPGAAAFSVAGFLGRLPISMVGLGIVFLVTGATGSYARAGILAAAFAVASALIAPVGSRLVDRFGQRPMLPLLAGAQVVMLISLVSAVDAGRPFGVQLATAVLAGGVGPNIGSMVRARWLARRRGPVVLHTAMAWEGIVDEIVFVVGPPLVTLLAVRFAPPAALLCAAALVGIGSFALALLRSTDPGPRPVTDTAGGRVAVALPGMAALVTTMIALGAVFGAFEVTTVAFADRLGRPEATGLLLGLYALGSLCAGVLVARLGPARQPARRLLRTTVLLALVSSPLWLVTQLWLLALLAFAAGLAVAPVLITTVSLVEGLVPAPRITEALTVISSGITLGVAAAAPVAGYLIDTGDPSRGYLLMATAASATLLVVAATRTRLCSHHGLRGSRPSDSSAVAQD